MRVQVKDEVSLLGFWSLKGKDPQHAWSFINSNRLLQSGLFIIRRQRRRCQPLRDGQRGVVRRRNLFCFVIRKSLEREKTKKKFLLIISQKSAVTRFQKRRLFLEMRISVDFQKAHRLNLIRVKRSSGGDNIDHGGGGGTDIAEPVPGDKHKGRARREKIVVSWPSVPFKEWAADRISDRCCFPVHAVSILSECCGIHLVLISFCLS